MKILAILHNVITGIQRVLHNKRGSLDKELLDVPQQVLDSFARLLLPKIQAFFESDGGKQEFEQWLQLKNANMVEQLK